MARPARFKEAIFRSATRLFGQRGLSGTGVREIAKEAGVSEAALYRHWKGKKQLARDIFVQGMADLHGFLTAEVPTDGPFCDAVRSMVRVFYHAYDENPVVFQYLLLNQHEVWRTMDSEDANPVGFWFDLLRSRSSEFQVEPELRGDVLGPITLGMILRPSIAAAYETISLPLAQYTEPVSLAICRVLGVPWTPSHPNPPPPEVESEPP
ncbi:MAG: TetR/AcrR family transcriptional regulator [bacterium]|nr:TetR/AcrR family transcriptional regulator [bacterium]